MDDARERTIHTLIEYTYTLGQVGFDFGAWSFTLLVGLRRGSRLIPRVERVYDSSEAGDWVRLYRKRLRISVTEKVCTFSEVEILVNVEYVNLFTYSSGRLKEIQDSGIEFTFVLFPPPTTIGAIGEPVMVLISVPCFRGRLPSRGSLYTRKTPSERW